MVENKANPGMRVWIVMWSVAMAVFLGLIMGLSKMPLIIVLLVALVPLVLGAWALTTVRRRLRTTHGEYEIETQAARTEATLVLGADPEAVKVAVCRLATGRFRVVGELPGELALRRRMNMATWGMTVCVRLTPVPEGTRIHVHVQPRLGTTIYDWGQGRRDILHLFEQIEEQLAGPGLPAG